MAIDFKLTDYAASVDRSAPRVVVAIVGELDLATAGRMEATVRDELANAPVLLDLSGVSFMDSSGVHALDRLLGDAARQGASLLIGPDLQAAVRDVLTMVGMMASLPIGPASSS